MPVSAASVATAVTVLIMPHTHYSVVDYSLIIGQETFPIQNIRYESTAFYYYTALVLVHAIGVRTCYRAKMAVAMAVAMAVTTRINILIQRNTNAIHVNSNNANIPQTPIVDLIEHSPTVVLGQPAVSVTLQIATKQFTNNMVTIQTLQ
jgi:hypothetical protein